MSVVNSVASIKADAKKASYNPLMQTLARLGYGVCGFIYIMIGFLALDIAPGKGGSPTDMKGAIAEIGKQPGGMAWEPEPGALWVAVNDRDGLGSDLVARLHDRVPPGYYQTAP